MNEEFDKAYNNKPVAKNPLEALDPSYVDTQPNEAELKKDLNSQFEVKEDSVNLKDYHTFKGISTVVGGIVWMIYLGSQFICSNIAPYI